MKLHRISLIPHGNDDSLPSAGIWYVTTHTMYLHGCESLFVFSIDFYYNRPKISFLDATGTPVLDLLWA